MARKKVTPDERCRIERAREFKRKAKSRKPGGPDDGDGEGDDVCAICDDGGFVTCCDGGCQRSFHLEDEHDADGDCRSKLGITKEQAKMINDKKEKFICKNCKYKQHQCFVCGLLGSSDLSSEPEVFRCEHDDCAYFYHPKCVAQLLYPDCELKATLFEEQVIAGEKFTCPRHECIKCRGGENKDDYQAQFAVCRRCPAVYHRKCLQSDILFKTDDSPINALPRAWDNILPDRILFYCKKHRIIKKLGTPNRNHIIFPDLPKMVGGLPTELDKPDEEELFEPQPMGQGKSEEKMLLAQQTIGQDKLGEEKVLDQQPIEQGKPEEEKVHDQRLVRKQSRSTPLAAKNKCSCAGPFDSFAPKALFMHPQPGSCGWLDE